MDKLRKTAYSLLRRSESVFKTDMVYLAKGGFWLTTLQVVSAFASLVMAIGFAHLLTKETYGTYKYIMSIGGVLTAFSLTGLSTVVTNAAARGQDGTLKLSFRKNLKWSALTLAAFLLTSTYYYYHHNPLLASGLIIIGVVTPFLGSASLADAFFVGKKDFKRSATTSGLAVIFTNAVTLIAAFLTDNILLIIAAYMISSALVELGIYAYAQKIYAPHSMTADRDPEYYAAHLSVMSIMSIFVDRLDSLLTFHFLGPLELAIYSFAVAIPEQIKGLLKNASPLALPKFSGGDIDILYRGLTRKVIVMTGGILAIALAYIAIAPIVFDILFPQYSGTAVWFSRIYAFTIIPTAAVLPVTFLQALPAKKELYYFNIFSGIFQIICMSVGIILFGLTGLIAAIGLSRLFRLIYSLALVRIAYGRTKTRAS